MALTWAKKERAGQRLDRLSGGWFPFEAGAVPAPARPMLGLEG
jgi:hypothetical protein